MSGQAAQSRGDEQLKTDPGADRVAGQAKDQRPGSIAVFLDLPV